MGSIRGLGFLKGSWDLVTRLILEVTILIITYSPNYGTYNLALLSPMILQVSLRDQVLKSVPLRVLQGYHTVLLEYHHGLGFRLGLYPKGPCTQRVYTLALK